MASRFFILLFVSLFGVSCTTTPVAHSPENDLGLLWVNNSAEYAAITTQVYQSATDDLQTFIDDESWSAMSGHPQAEGLPPAVVLDVDETTISNAKFQVAFERPMEQWKLEKWNDEHTSDPVPGVVDFVTAAEAAGVTVFFVTNRPCDPTEGDSDPCPQKNATVRDIGELGISTDAAHVLLARENGWTRAKIARREYIAERYRVIMLFGDDLGDFAPCVRVNLYGACLSPATKESRRHLVEAFSNYWGHGWYMLPGPTHGSWTSFTD